MRRVSMGRDQGMASGDRRGGAALLAFFLVGLASSARASGGPTAAGRIADLEGRYSQTFVTGDERTAARTLADAFIGFDSKGRPTSKSKMLEEVRRRPHQTSARITALTVRLYGDTAIALGSEDDTSPGTREVAHRRWLDTWKRGPSGWRMISSAEVAPSP